MESGLIFNQLICEFESRHPCQLWANAECDYICKMSGHTRLLVALLVWVVAQLAEHRTVTAAREGSTPFGPPNSLSIFDCRLPIDGTALHNKSAIANWQSQMFGNCGREVRHLIVDQADDGSSPFSSAILCQRPDR